MKTSASLVEKASFASKAPLVSLDTKWNVTVPRMKMTMTHRERVSYVMLVTAVLASMASLAPMVLASMASMASMVGVATLRWRDLRNQTLVYAPVDLVVMRWIFNSGEITVVYELGQNTPRIWLCSSTKLAWEDDGSRSSRRAMMVATNGGVDGWRRWMA